MSDPCNGYHVRCMACLEDLGEGAQHDVSVCRANLRRLLKVIDEIEGPESIPSLWPANRCGCALRDGKFIHICQLHAEREIRVLAKMQEQRDEAQRKLIEAQAKLLDAVADEARREALREAVRAASDIASRIAQGDSCCALGEPRHLEGLAVAECITNTLRTLAALDKLEAGRG